MLHNKLLERIDRIKDIGSCYSIIGKSQGRLLQCLTVIDYLGQATRKDIAEYLDVNQCSINLARYEDVYIDAKEQYGASRRLKQAALSYTLSKEGKQLIEKAKQLGIIDTDHKKAA